MDEKSLRNWIDMISFCMDDMLLYLDTHPQDQNALNYMEQYQNLRKEAVKVFSMRFYPLTVDEAENGNMWRWVTSPWPWEGGC